MELRDEIALSLSGEFIQSVLETFKVDDLKDFHTGNSAVDLLQFHAWFRYKYADTVLEEREKKQILEQREKIVRDLADDLLNNELKGFANPAEWSQWLNGILRDDINISILAIDRVISKSSNPKFWEETKNKLIDLYKSS